MPEGVPGTWLDLFHERVEAEPHRCALTVLGDGDRVTEAASYAELERRARAVAVAIEDAGAAGRPVVLALPTGLAFAEALIGCFLAGSPAVPIPALIRGRGLERVAAVLADAGAAAILVDRDAVELPGAAQPSRGAVRIVVGAVETEAAGRWSPRSLDPSAIAFLQYTSGSTAAPKGVAVPHAALVANLAMMRGAFRYDRSWRSVNWMPLHHDMGLVIGLLQPLACFEATVLLPPLAVVQRPVRLLRAVARHRATTAGGPSFIFETCVARVRAEDCEGLDLSSWRHAYCGAEMVRPASLARFASRFAPFGLRGDAPYPCYGLAEATLLATGSAPGAPVATATIDRAALRDGLARDVAPDDPAWRDAFTVAGCGTAPAPGRLAIVDPASARRLPENRVGEILVAGPHVAAGYWGRADATAEVFAARIAGEEEAPWLRTGDLGFRRDGMLFVVGRLKDIVIVRGANHHAEDIEATVRLAHPLLRDVPAAAFAVDDGVAERLVVAVELRYRAAGAASLPPIAAAIARRVIEVHGVRPDEVLLLRPGTLPRTTSGKIRRRRCAEARALGVWPEPGRRWLPDEPEIAPEAAAG
jgi:acyl-CoA synthetase (AMP-forming)/AMP-acid ligase II